MSKELDSIIEDCKRRMDSLNIQREYCRDVEDLNTNELLWWQHYNRLKAAHSTKLEQMWMNWTASGDFSHLQSTPPLRF